MYIATAGPWANSRDNKLFGSVKWHSVNFLCSTELFHVNYNSQVVLHADKRRNTMKVLKLIQRNLMLLWLKVMPLL